MNTQNKIMSLIIILSLFMALFSPQLLGSKFLMNVISVIIGFVSLIGIIYMFMGNKPISVYNFIKGLWVFRYKRYRLIKRYLGKARKYFRNNRILLFIVVLTISINCLNVIKYKFRSIEKDVYIIKWEYDSINDKTEIRYAESEGEIIRLFNLEFKGCYYFITERYYYIKYRNNVLLDFREIIK